MVLHQRYAQISFTHRIREQGRRRPKSAIAVLVPERVPFLKQRLYDTLSRSHCIQIRTSIYAFSSDIIECWRKSQERRETSLCRMGNSQKQVSVGRRDPRSQSMFTQHSVIEPRLRLALEGIDLLNSHSMFLRSEIRLGQKRQVA